MVIRLFLININHCIVFCRLISLQTHGSITQTQLPKLYLPRTCSNTTFESFNATLCLVWTPTKVLPPKRSPQGQSKQNIASNWDKVEMTAIISVTLATYWKNFWAWDASPLLVPCLCHLGIHSEQSCILATLQSILPASPVAHYQLPKLLKRRATGSQSRISCLSVKRQSC